MGAGDDRSSDDYHKRWDAIAAEQEAKVVAEDEAAVRGSDAALGLSAAAYEPRSSAEAEERSKRDALKSAKAFWKDKDRAATASKFMVGEESGITRTLTQADLGGDKHAVHIKGAKGCTYTLDALMRVAKVFVEGCSGCVVRVQCLVVSQHVEVWACDGVELVLEAPVATVQVDGSAQVAVAFAQGDMLGAVVHATCASLSISFEGSAEVKDLVAAENDPDGSVPGAQESGAGRGDANSTGEIPQFITRRVNGTVITERVVRGKDEYPTTVREMILARAEAAAGGDALAAAALAADAPIDTDTAAARAEGRKEKGNEAFKEGNYSQAAVFYTQVMELAPAHHVALANRSACFLKLGEHEKALEDAEACIAAKPDFVKGHFRKGLSLHAMVSVGHIAHRWILL